MEAILSIITKYWVEFILAGIGAGLLAWFKKFKKTMVIGKEEELKDKIHKPILEEVDIKLDKTKEEINERLVAVEEKADQVKKASDDRKVMYFEHEKKIYDKIDEITNKVSIHIESLEKSGKERGEESRKRDELIINAILYLQRKDFLRSCEELLTPGREITFDEYNAIQEDHEVYNKLGGNHRGDTLFKDIQDKYRLQTQKKNSENK